MSLPDSFRAAYLLGPEQLEIRAEPLAPPAPGELLVRIEAALTCGTDVKVYRRGGHPRMLRAPARFGHEMAGVVAAVGAGVRGWAAGDRVAVANSAPCGACADCRAGRENLCPDLEYLNGAFAEFLRVPPRFVARSLYRLPADLPAATAALAEPLACVLHGGERLGLQPGEPGAEILVLGAGPIGLLFVAALAADGHRVVAADPHPERLAVAAGLGAAATQLVERSEPAARRIPASAAAGFTATIDAAGGGGSWATALASLRPGGRACLFAGPPEGTRGEVDLHALHYAELAAVGAYHYRPTHYAAAVERLRSLADIASLITAERPLAELEEGLRAMMRREALKVLIRP